MSFPQPEWAAIEKLTPPSKWAVLADRIGLVEYRIDRLQEKFTHLLDRLQELGAVAESDELWEQCEALRRDVEHIPSDVQNLDQLLAELFTKFGPKVKNSLGQRYVHWREGPWYYLAPKDTDG